MYTATFIEFHKITTRCLYESRRGIGLNVDEPLKYFLAKGFLGGRGGHMIHLCTDSLKDDLEEEL